VLSSVCLLLLCWTCTCVLPHKNTQFGPLGLYWCACFLCVLDDRLFQRPPARDCHTGQSEYLEFSVYLLILR
jgi:hypothetical protein